jgi:hypothetical protein
MVFQGIFPSGIQELLTWSPFVTPPSSLKKLDLVHLEVESLKEGNNCSVCIWAAVLAGVFGIFSKGAAGGELFL